MVDLTGFGAPSWDRAIELSVGLKYEKSPDLLILFLVVLNRRPLFTSFDRREFRE